MSIRREKLDSIQVVNRHRQDLGDLSELEKSIKQYGLLHPVVVTPELVLVAGERRIAACRNIGMDEVAVTVVTTMADAADLLRAERDENTCRKDFAPSEFVALGKALETLERPKAKERQGTRTDLHRQLPADSAESSKREQHGVREIVSEAVGVSHDTYSKAKYVVEATEDENEQVASTARAAVDEMDRTGKVAPAFKRVKEERAATGQNNGKLDKTKAGVLARRDRIRSLAEQNYSTRQIAESIGITEKAIYDICKAEGIAIPADAHVKGTRRVDPVRVVGQTVTSLEGLVMSLDLIKPADVAGHPELADWLVSLSTSLQFLNRFHKQLKETGQ